ncbi:MAG: hypothetical protein ACI9WU_003134 [Myxococcota bacterium]|jgi:hypothetical protein
MDARMVRALCARRVLPLKEVFESFEFFERVRGRVRAPNVADICCGHGLTGLLFAAFERQVETVFLVDKAPPPSHTLVLDAICEVAPWTRDKIQWLAQPLQQARKVLRTQTTILGLHACGIRTDHCIDMAIELGGHTALVPCCYQGQGREAPDALRQQLGVPTATDVHRTYRLEGANYDVTWSGLPQTVTPMNRLIIGTCKTLQIKCEKTFAL